MADALPDTPHLDHWLEILSRTVPGAVAALATLKLGARGEPRAPAVWPADGDSPQRLAGVATAAVSRRVPLVMAVPGEAGEGFDFGYPLLRDGKPCGVVAMTVRAAPAEQQAVMQMLRVGGAWLDLLLRAGLDASARAAAAGQADSAEARLLDVAAAALGQRRAAAAALAATSTLAARFDCERVAYGRLRRGRASVLAISDTAEVDGRRTLVRAIAGAMEEAAAGEAPLVFTHGQQDGVSAVHAHRALAETGECPVIVSVPCAEGDTIAVLTAECAAGTDTAALAPALQSAGVLLGAILAARTAAERGVLARARASVGGALGGERVVRKLAGATLVLALAAGVAYTVVGTGEYTVSGEATVEGRVQRAIVAPFDGYLAEVNAVPGDAVRAGQALAVLDDRTLKLEHRKLAGERDALRKRHRQALAGLDKSEARIVTARIEQVAARLDLLDAQLQRARLLAPFDGVVLSGDLSRSLGKPVAQGEVLLEVAPLGDYRVALEVDGRDVADLVPGQAGEIRLAALPDDTFPIEVEKLSAVAGTEARAGLFRVEAKLLAASPRIRPGMRGVARLVVGERTLAEVWFGRALTPLRLWWWTWAP